MDLSLLVVLAGWLIIEQDLHIELYVYRKELDPKYTHNNSDRQLLMLRWQGLFKFTIRLAFQKGCMMGLAKVFIHNISSA